MSTAKIILTEDQIKDYQARHICPECHRPAFSLVWTNDCILLCGRCARQYLWGRLAASQKSSYDLDYPRTREQWETWGRTYENA